jgi:CheY-like chemotaxis protein
MHGAAAGVFDAQSTGAPAAADLARLRKNLGPAVPIVALVGFPRVEDRDAVVAAGATAVLSKPLAVEDLVWQLNRLSDTPSSMTNDQ